LLDQTALQLYEIKALAHNQVRIQPKTPDAHRAIIKVLADKNTSFHTFKPKEERPYRVVLKNMNFSINPSDIQSEIEKLGHTFPTFSTSSSPSPCSSLISNLHQQQRHLPSGIPSRMQDQI
jgi:hypothetical protein